MATIQTKGLTYRYGIGTPFEKTAVDHVDLEIESGSFVGIIGHTGSGKSTLIQHLNGLLKPTEGSILLDGKDIWAEKAQMRQVRFRVGLVFQYPEYQIFEETVAKDIAFGPRNMGLAEEEVQARVKETAAIVGLSDDILEQSPFLLSGGQKRRVAIAGVMAMRPEVLILDEPTAGLDPRGREEILEEIKAYRRQTGATILLVSHSMEDVARHAQQILVMNAGKVFCYGTVENVFRRSQELQAIGLAVPQITRVCNANPADGRYFHGRAGERTADRMVPEERGTVTMLKDITIGQYFPGSSPVHRMDPRFMSIMTLLFIAMLFMGQHLYSILFGVVFCILALSFSKIPVRLIWKSIKPLIPVLMITAVLDLLMVDSGDVYWKWHFLKLTEGGVRTAILMVTRIIVLLAGSSLLTYTTSPIALTDAIERLLSPLKKLHVPVHTFAMMMTISLRFIPTLLEETDKIMTAQKARGASFSEGNLVQRAKALVPILVPLLVSSFHRAEELATAMECRCYRGEAGRTKMRQLHAASRDYIAMTVTVLLFAAAVAVKIIW